MKKRPIGLSFIDINKSYKSVYQPVEANDSDSDTDDEYASDLLSPPNVRPRHLRTETTIGTKIKRIETGRSAKQLQKKKRIKSNRTIHDWCAWYLQAPRARFPFVYFLVIFLCCFILPIYWLMDNDSSFITCGIIGLTTCAYATYKFRLSLNLKREVDKYRQLNLRMHREQIKLAATIQRVENAVDTLRKCKRRLTKANEKNRQNLHNFDNIQTNMKLLGKEANLELTNINALTHDIRFAWREELLSNEREMLHTVYEHFERLHTGKSRMGLTKNDFEAFQKMLPERYEKRWRRMGTFNAFAGDDDGQIDEDDFVNTLDTFALMETDNKDIAFPAALRSCLTADVYSPSTPALNIPSRDLYAETPDVLEESISIVVSPPESYALSPPKYRTKKQVRFNK